MIAGVSPGVGEDPARAAAEDRTLDNPRRDPGCAVRGSPDAVAWICPHAFAAMQIDALADGSTMRFAPSA